MASSQSASNQVFEGGEMNLVQVAMPPPSVVGSMLEVGGAPLCTCLQDGVASVQPEAGPPMHPQRLA
eukprot:3983096-Karenia_brevis.AAC.1